jgi:Sulfotransferase domain
LTNQNVKIFGIGLSRTGTVSLTNALMQLGISAKHYPNDVRTQEELKRGHYSLSVLSEAQALLDIPISPYYSQFDHLYPQAKFILTTRSTDSWLISVEKHFQLYVENMRDDFDDYVIACVYGSLHFNAERFRFVKDLHETNVTTYFSDRPEKLLVFDVFRGDSWPELCAFLDYPIPKLAFPHENRALSDSAKQSRRKSMRRLVREAKHWLRLDPKR